MGMKMADLWESLHDDYNTLRIPIQCQRAFHLDVKELATKAKDRDEFHCLMTERSQARFGEIVQALDDVAEYLVASPRRFPYDLWPQFLAFARSMSAADLAIFFAGFEDPEDIEHRKYLETLRHARRRRADAAEAAALLPLGRESPLAAPTSAPTPTDPPTPPDSALPNSVSPSDPLQLPTDTPIQRIEPTPPTSPPTSSQSRDDTTPISKPSPPRRSNRTRKQSTDEIVKRNLRPRAAGIPQRKEQIGSTQRKKRPRGNDARNSFKTFTIPQQDERLPDAMAIQSKNPTMI
jgi:hypothetical protein